MTTARVPRLADFRVADITFDYALQRMLCELEFTGGQLGAQYGKRLHASSSAPLMRYLMS